MFTAKRAFGVTALFDGFRIDADSTTDPRWDRVLPVFEEAQTFMCRQMNTLLDSLPKNSLMLDVGTGSGVFAIWAAKRGHRIVGVDINPRALGMARQNALNNGVTVYDSVEEMREAGICLLLREFNKSFITDQAFVRRFNCVFLNPPYSPTCPGVRPALHAESGEDGQRCFREQIAIVPDVMPDQGWCVGIQMTVKTEHGIDCLQQIQQSFGKDCKIQYTHILDEEYFPTKEFLQSQYGSYLQEGRSSEPNSTDVRSYIERVSRQNPQLAFIYYEVQKVLTDQSEPTPKRLQRVFAPNRGWEDRIRLHKQIVDHTTQRSN
jgi:16S rRNA G966 N2-methylase RsmD